MDIVTGLANPLYSPFSLFQPRRVPGQVDIDLSAQSLKVEAFTCCIRRAHQPNIALLDGWFDLLACSRPPIFSALNERRRSAELSLNLGDGRGQAAAA